jgi:hypothetical protein
LILAGASVISLTIAGLSLNKVNNLQKQAQNYATISQVDNRRDEVYVRVLEEAITRISSDFEIDSKIDSSAENTFLRGAAYTAKMVASSENKTFNSTVDALQPRLNRLEIGINSQKQWSNDFTNWLRNSKLYEQFQVRTK